MRKVKYANNYAIIFLNKNKFTLDDFNDALKEYREFLNVEEIVDSKRTFDIKVRLFDKKEGLQKVVYEFISFLEEKL